MPNKKISIISPVYGCEQSLIELVFVIKEQCSKIGLDYEIVFIDDSSPDNAWETIKKLSNENPQVKGLRLSRNFGQHKAIFAGLEHAKGEWIVVMDCDLQDNPEEITNLYHHAITNNLDLVLGKRENRQDKTFKKWFSTVFYRILGYLTDTSQDSSIANFGIYHHKVIHAVLEMGDSFKYFPAMIKWVGFKSDAITVKHNSRKFGKTTYSFRKLLHLGMEVILAFSDKPLRMTVKLGLTISLVAFIIGIITIVKYLQGKILVLGYASQILSIWFFGGIVIFILGFIGLYVGKTFEKVKERPSYIIAEKSED